MTSARKEQEKLGLMVGRGFTFIAFWQSLVFVMLILLTWANEVLDISALLFGTAERPPDITRGCVATAGLLIGAIITVGNTYIQQHRLVSGILTICSYCKKIRIECQMWQQIEEYINRRSPIEFSHGICPDCLAREKRNLEESDDA
ncbi:MAG: hypothetical protein O3B24_01445 [Verrucomicrobia bacterium]|nr:hypothetical protein [Verrucomicrobiota bacterium]